MQDTPPPETRRLDRQEASPLFFPAKIGPYKIERLLAQGGMSLIYLATHPKTHQTIVVKILKNKYLKNNKVISHLLQEAKILGLAHHPNIATLYELGQWEGGLFIAMEFVQGISLHQFLKERSLLPKRALEIVLQVANAVNHLHAQGIIHCDLKPGNILITESGCIKLIDFGISQFINTKEAAASEQTGTPPYMDPEQKNNPDRISYATDIFSLGIIAYELYLGRFSHGVIQLSLLPVELRKIIERAIHETPEKRYTHIADFISDLTQFLKTFDETKEIREESAFEELLPLIQGIQSILLPKKAPQWPDTEIGLALREGSFFNGFYVDFFSLTQNTLAFIFSKPVDVHKDPLAHALMLRGMIRVAGSQAKESHLFLEQLNRSLIQDPAHQQYNFALLLLDIEKNFLSFASCNLGSLWHCPDQSLEARLLEAPNPPLGANPNAAFLVIEENWNPRDTLFFSSFLLKNATDSRLLTAQHLAEETLSLTKGEAAAVIIRRQ